MGRMAFSVFETRPLECRPTNVIAPFVPLATVCSKQGAFEETDIAQSTSRSPNFE